MKYSLKINGCNLVQVESVVDLGVTFNKELSWTNHINITIGIVQAMLTNLWVIQNSTPFHVRMLLAIAYLIPDLLYGCEIYANCDNADFLKFNAEFNNIAR